MEQKQTPVKIFEQLEPAKPEINQFLEPSMKWAT